MVPCQGWVHTIDPAFMVTRELGGVKKVAVATRFIHPFRAAAHIPEMLIAQLLEAEVCPRIIGGLTPLVCVRQWSGTAVIKSCKSRGAARCLCSNSLMRRSTAERLFCQCASPAHGSDSQHRSRRRRHCNASGNLPCAFTSSRRARRGSAEVLSSRKAPAVVQIPTRPRKETTHAKDTRRNMGHGCQW